MQVKVDSRPTEEQQQTWRISQLIKKNIQTKTCICIRIPIRRYNSCIACIARRNIIRYTLAMEIRARAWCTPETYSRIWRKQVFFCVLCVLSFIEFMNETSFVSSNFLFLRIRRVVASILLIKFDLHKLSMVALCVMMTEKTYSM